MSEITIGSRVRMRANWVPEFPAYEGRHGSATSVPRADGSVWLVRVLWDHHRDVSRWSTEYLELVPCTCGGIRSVDPLAHSLGCDIIRRTP